MTIEPPSPGRAPDSPSLSGMARVIPTVRSFQPSALSPFRLRPSTVIVTSTSSPTADADRCAPGHDDSCAQHDDEVGGLLDTADLLASEIGAMCCEHDLGLLQRPPVVSVVSEEADRQEGRILLVVAPHTPDREALGAEGYEMEVTTQQVTITAATAAGVFSGTRTLLQCLAGEGRVEAGVVQDSPSRPVRGLHLDAARKYFTLDWLLDRVREMSWVKLNELQLHFSENEGFRLESHRHPEVVSAAHLSQSELARLVAVAARYHVEIIPAFDVPGHMEAVLNAHPQWRVDDTAAGRRILDYSQPGARALVADIIDEFAPLFPSRSWHLGGDEVFPLGADDEEDDARFHRDMGERFPQLLDYARAHCRAGSEATVLDGYVAYLETVATQLHDLGKDRVRVWNDALSLPGTSQTLPADVTVTYWSGGHRTFPTVRTLVDEGHDIINVNDTRFYYVLAQEGHPYFRIPTAEEVYGWRPGHFPEHRVHGPQAWPDPQPDWNLGASFAIWCDVPEAQTEAEVAQGVRPLLRAMASRIWNPDDAAPYSLWRRRERLLGSAVRPSTV
ncbi:glycoside hydrolase family 20 protein [Actinomyces sp. ZJ308]|uniref:beta-N-acetylhexosaminidase n=1 Tax=Actinomyces sp. ZJ308 TaxID=2708342 RepID=UPI001420F5BD|nr:glycoside hydrolase family 20 protein [Actinomyces sp. ZJ308]